MWDNIFSSRRGKRRAVRHGGLGLFLCSFRSCFARDTDLIRHSNSTGSLGFISSKKYLNEYIYSRVFDMLAGSEYLVYYFSVFGPLVAFLPGHYFSAGCLGALEAFFSTATECTGDSEATD